MNRNRGHHHATRHGLAIKIAAPLAVVGAALAVWSAGCGSPRERHPGVRNIALSGRRGHLEFTFRQREESRTSKTGASDERFAETIFEERLRLATGGSIYHPNLLEFSLAGLFGLQQNDFEQSVNRRRGSTSKEGDILEFDLTGTVFKMKPYPLTFFARRGRSLEPRPFRSSVNTTSTSFGLTWQYVSTKTPTKLRFNHTVVERDPLIQAGEQKGREENIVLRLETAYRFSDRNVLSLTLDHKSIEQRPFATEFRTDNVRLTHRLDFGAEGKDRLESQFTFNKLEGSFDSKRVQWLETLRLKHSDRLRTQFQFELSDRTQGNLAGSDEVGEQSYRLAASVEHRLYESLETSLSGEYQELDFDGGLVIRRSSGRVGLVYRKLNRWGKLRASYRVRYERENRSGGEVDFEVLDEPITFTDPQPVFLIDSNVDLTSVRLLRQDRAELYQTGRDYRLRVIGDRVEVERVVTGRIADGDTVLVSYRFHVGGSYQLSTWTQELSVRQQFDLGLTPYYRLRNKSQTLRPKSATGITPEDVTAHTVGVEYKRPSLQLRAEFEDYDSTIAPFRAVRLSAGYHRLLKHGATFGLTADWSDIRFGAPDPRNTRLLTLEVSYRHPITDRFKVEARVAYRNEEDTLTGDDEGTEVDLSLEWSIRQTEVRVVYAYATFEDDFAEQDTSSLFVMIRRRF